MNSKTQRLHFRRVSFKSRVLEEEWLIHSAEGCLWEKVGRMESTKAEGLNRVQEERHPRGCCEPGRGHADSKTTGTTSESYP